MYEDLEILQKLYSLQKSLIDVDEINIIKRMIEKRNIEISLDGFSDYTQKEIGYMTIGVRNMYFEAVAHVEFVYGQDVEDEIYDEEYYKEIDKMFSEFQLIKLKIHKQKESQLKKVAQENFKLIIKDKFIKTIIKYLEL